MALIIGTPYEVSDDLLAQILKVSDRVKNMRVTGALTPEVLSKLRKYFRIKNIYHSNAIEGNTLDTGETRLVVEQGLTITGKPLKDQAEAKNLSAALDFLEELASNASRPILESDVRQIHYLVLKDIRDLDAGVYRTAPVEISGSAFKPPAPGSVASEMTTFGLWLQNASTPEKTFTAQEAISAASAAHTWFVMIHPFIDGNGRVARLLMNLLLMRYGYPIAVITREDRRRYYDALEMAQSSDLTPFVALVSECIEESLEEYESAAEEQREAIEWAKSIASKFDQKEKVRASNRYEVWKSAMDLLKNLFRQTAERVSSTTHLSRIHFRDFGILEFEKYLSLGSKGSAKKTWFFRLDFRSGSHVARYLFFFGAPSQTVRHHPDATLHISREDPPGSFRYERLDVLFAPNLPNLTEIGYNPSDESFLVRERGTGVHTEKVESICRRFVQEVIEKHFTG